MIFKGYVVVYKVDETEDVITVFGFARYRNKPI